MDNKQKNVIDTGMPQEEYIRHLHDEDIKQKRENVEQQRQLSKAAEENKVHEEKQKSLVAKARADEEERRSQIATKEELNGLPAWFIDKYTEYMRINDSIVNLQNYGTLDRKPEIGKLMEKSKALEAELSKAVKNIGSITISKEPIITYISDGGYKIIKENNNWRVEGLSDCKIMEYDKTGRPTAIEGTQTLQRLFSKPIVIRTKIEIKYDKKVN